MLTELHVQQGQIAELCGRHHVRRLDVFGSAATGDFDPARSDLDFLVEFDDLPPVAFADAFFGLREGLEALFSRPVDLVTPESVVNPYLRASIAAGRQPLYGT